MLKWIVPAIIGIGAGYMLSPMISRFLPIKPFQAMAARRVSAPIHPVHPASVAHHPAVHPAAAAATPTMHYVPVRRSFDRSYDSWLHTTVNALPSIG